MEKTFTQKSDCQFQISKLLSLLLFFLFSFQINAQTVLLSEEFEGPTFLFTPNHADCNDGAGDYFNVTDGSNIPVTYVGATGSYYAVMDTDGCAANPGQDFIDLDFNDICITGYMNLEICVSVAEADASNGAEDWDGSSSVSFQYDIDNSGTYTTVLAIESELGTDGNETNEIARIDTDFDGVGDGAEITPTFTEYCAVFLMTGDEIDLRINIDNLDAGDEDIAIDNFRLEAVPGCALTDMVLANVACSNPGMDADPTNDVITFSLNPTTACPGGTYNVSDQFGGGTVTPATGTYGVVTNFQLQPGSAGGGDVTILVADDENPACELSETITDPGVCSAAAVCDISSVTTANVNCISNMEFTMDITVEFTNPPATGDLQVEIGAGSTASIPVGSLVGNSHTFTAVAGMSGQGTVNVTASFTDDQACLLAIPFLTPDCICMPSITCPEPGTFDCDDVAGITAWAAGVVFDDCGLPGFTVTNNFNPATATCATNTITFTLLDAAGLAVDDCNAELTINPVPLVLNGPADLILQACTSPADSATMISNWLASFSFTGGCGATGGFNPFTIEPLCVGGQTVVTFMVTDLCGATDFLIRNIFVNADTEDPVFSSACPTNMTIECDVAVPAPMMMMATDNCQAPNSMIAFINELHYDNPGTDVGEFVEVAGTAGLDLTGYQLVLYNGSNAGVYNTINLAGIIPDEGAGFGAIAFTFPSNGLQNGSPDGMALVDPSGMVVEFISYEGTITASSGPAMGLTSTDIGIAESPGAIGESLQLTGSGGMGSDFTWVGPLAESPGLLNAGQTIVPNLAPVPVTFSEVFVAGACGSTGTITRTWTAEDMCGNTAECIQIIDIVDNTAPTFLGTLPMDITVECDAIPTAPTLNAVDNCGSGAPIWINEIHYDNTGTDANEQIEIAGVAGTDLSSYSLVLYNGSNGFSYNTISLSGIIPDEGAGFGAISFTISGIQNGAPDGIALAQGTTAIEFLSYEGTMVANNGPASGMTSTDIGVSESSGDPLGLSLQLIGTGSGASSFTWTGPVTASAGLLNVGQTVVGNLTVTFSEVTVAGGCAGESTITRTWSTMDACGNPATLVQVITVEDNNGPSVTCQDITVELDANGNASIVPNDVLGMTSDVCGTVTLSLDIMDFTCANVGPNTVTLTAIDDCGNPSTCTATVTVVDLIDPEITCPNDIVINLDPGLCRTTVYWNDATATDNCGIQSVVQTAGPLSGTFFERGTTTTVTYLATDLSGNTAECSFTITIIEFQNPTTTIACNDHVNISLDDNCQAVVGADMILEGGPYGCYDDYIVSIDGGSNIADAGMVGLTLPVTVTDPNGNTCWGTATFEDKIAPQIVCYDKDLTCDEPLPSQPAPDNSIAGSVATITAGGNGNAAGGMVFFDVTNSTASDLIVNQIDMSIDGATLVDIYLTNAPGTFAGNETDPTAWTLIAQADATTGPFGVGVLTPATTSFAIPSGTWGIALHTLSTGSNYTNGDGTNQSFTDGTLQLDLGSSSNGFFAAPTFAPRVFNGALNYEQNFPEVIPSDGCGTVTVTFDDVVTDHGCTGDFSQTIVRTWTATDGSGNSASCTSTYRRIRPTLADITIPTDITIDCSQDPNDLSLTGEPTGASCGGIDYTYDPNADVVVDICEGSKKVIRTWTLVDWCTNEVETHTQLIKVLDTTGPVVTNPGTLTIGTTSNACAGNVILPILSATDDCSSIGTPIFSLGGTVIANGILTNAPVGTHTIDYSLSDGCGNESTGSFQLVVEDNIAPLAICDQHTTASIGSDGYVTIDALTFDDGSYDNCGIVSMEVRRMNNTCGMTGATQFGPNVTFCCADIGSIVMVAFRVIDAAGNINTCMVEVTVDDKIAPTIVCPANKTINCTDDYTDLGLTGEAVATDNCSTVTPSYIDNANLNDCGEGTITRIWSVQDDAGNPASCVQFITLVNPDPFYINPGWPLDPNDDVVWPLDYETFTCGSGLDPENLVAPFNEPVLSESACGNIFVGHDDLNLSQQDPACIKILRTWTVIDWCQYEPNNPASGGIWTYDQILKITNSLPPMVDCTGDAFTQNFDANCGTAFVNLTASATDDCTPVGELSYSYSVTNSSGAVVKTGTGTNASDDFGNGSYSIAWTVEDGCGNYNTCDFPFEVADAKKPTPVCVSLSSVVMPNSGMVTLQATDFESGSSFDNCTPYSGLQFSFSSDVTNTALNISCADIANTNVVTVEIWATDAAGNQDFCSTFVVINDTENVCNIIGQTTINPQGTILTASQNEIELVDVSLLGSTFGTVTTGANGTYTFPTMPIATAGTYEVSPYKNINPTNGVTTFDLVQIQKHILGIELLDSPYKEIAADGNDSETITTFDLVVLRKLILGTDTEFQGSQTSWRFVDAAHTFPNGTFPFPETVDVSALPTGSSADFVGVKIGDINGSASPNSLLGTDTRTFDGTLVFHLENKKVNAGEEFTVDFRAKDFNNTLGYQFTLGFDNNAITFDDLTSNLVDLSEENFGFAKLDEGIITTSWNSNKEIDVKDDEVLFSLTFTANKAVQVNELFSINSRYTQAEAYNGSDLYDVALAFDGSVIANKFELYQNTPNPFKEVTTISFNLPEAAATTLKIYDVSGKVLRMIDFDGTKGYNEVVVSRSDLSGSGVLYYQVETANHTATLKMILVD